MSARRTPVCSWTPHALARRGRVTAALGALCNQAESPAVREAFVHAEGVARLVPFLTNEAPAAWVAEGGAEAMEGDERGEGPSAPPGMVEIVLGRL